MLCINFAFYIFPSLLFNKHMCFNAGYFSALCWQRLVFCILMSDFDGCSHRLVLCKCVHMFGFVWVLVWDVDSKASPIFFFSWNSNSIENSKADKRNTFGIKHCHSHTTHEMRHACKLAIDANSLLSFCVNSLDGCHPRGLFYFGLCSTALKQSFNLFALLINSKLMKIVWKHCPSFHVWFSERPWNWTNDNAR